MRHPQVVPSAVLALRSLAALAPLAAAFVVVGCKKDTSGLPADDDSTSSDPADDDNVGDDDATYDPVDRGDVVLVVDEGALQCLYLDGVLASIAPTVEERAGGPVQYCPPVEGEHRPVMLDPRSPHTVRILADAFVDPFLAVEEDCDTDDDGYFDEDCGGSLAGGTSVSLLCGDIEVPFVYAFAQDHGSSAARPFGPALALRFYGPEVSATSAPAGTECTLKVDGSPLFGEAAAEFPVGLGYIELIDVFPVDFDPNDGQPAAINPINSVEFIYDKELVPGSIEVDDVRVTNLDSDQEVAVDVEVREEDPNNVSITFAGGPWPLGRYRAEFVGLALSVDGIEGGYGAAVEFMVAEPLPFGCEDAAGTLPGDQSVTGIFLNVLDGTSGRFCMFDDCGNPLTPGDATLPANTTNSWIPPQATAAPYVLPVGIDVQIGTWFQGDIGATCPADGDSPGQMVDLTVTASALPKTSVRPIGVLAGAPLDFSGVPMSVCGPAGTAPCPPPAIHIVDSTCEPTSGQGTFRIWNLDARFGPMAFEITHASGVLQTVILEFLELSDYYSIPNEPDSNFAVVQIEATDESGAFRGSWAGTGAPNSGSFSGPLYDSLCGSMIFTTTGTGSIGTFQHLVEKPTLCSPYYGVGAPDVCLP